MSNRSSTERSAQEKASKLGIELLPLKDSFAEMRKRMIDGWAMRQETCPITGFPLISKGGVLWSIRCQCQIKDPNSTTGGIELKKAETPKPPASNTPVKNSSKTKKKTQFLGTPGRRERMNVQSKRISEKLLMGWKMLKTVCPITNECPVLEDKNGRQWSAALNMYLDEYKEEEDTPTNETPPTQTHMSQPTASVQSASSISSRSNNVVVDEPAPEHDFTDGWKPPTAEEEREMAEKQKRHDEMSKKMGQMLLTGWKMLDEICPVTGEVPLMQDKDGRKFSVALNACIGEDGSKEDEELEPSSQPTAVLESSPITKFTPEVKMMTVSEDNNRRNAESKPVSVPAPDANNDYDEEFIEISSKPLAIEKALNALHRKLSKLSDDLERTSSGSEVKLILENIVVCTEAIKGLKGIQSV